MSNERKVKREIYKAFEVYNEKILNILFIDPPDSKETFNKRAKELGILCKQVQDIAIHQKPEIDDMKKYVEEKARAILDISTEWDDKCESYLKELKLVKVCITQIVSDVMWGEALNVRT